FTIVYDGANKGPHLWVSREGGESGEVSIPESYLSGLPADDLWGHLKIADVGVRQFVRNVAEGTSEGPNFYDGLLAQLVIDAAFESNREGVLVTITN
ncbi:MAG: hypothetical protein RLZZ600_789, partial [Actinomycetota bacterium]